MSQVMTEQTISIDKYSEETQKLANELVASGDSNLFDIVNFIEEFSEVQFQNYFNQYINLIDVYDEYELKSFIDDYGIDAIGYFADYNQLIERDGYSVDAVNAFVELYGLECIEHFEDSYYGEYDWDDFVYSFVTDNVIYEIPVSLRQYFDYAKYGDDLKYDFDESEGFIFARF